jgi:hypothetical protein
MTIEQQNKTPGQHAEKPSPAPRDPFPELKARDDKMRKAVRSWLQRQLVVSGLEGAQVVVGVDLEPDVLNRPSDRYDREQKLAFREFHWWFKKATVRLDLEPDEGDDYELARTSQSEVAEGQVTEERHVGSWEGEVAWTSLLEEAVAEATRFLRMAMSPVRLAVEETDEPVPTPSTVFEPS